jgi:hypothetical protein
LSARAIANQKPKLVLVMSPEAAYVLEKLHLQALLHMLPPVYEVSINFRAAVVPTSDDDRAVAIWLLLRDL